MMVDLTLGFPTAIVTATDPVRHLLETGRPGLEWHRRAVTESMVCLINMHLNGKTKQYIMNNDR